MTKARDIANAGTAFTTVTPTELGYVDGVTSAIQTQINTKQAVVSGVNDTEIGYLDGVTSAIQTQLNARIPASIATTKGDIIVATGNATLVRQGVGANGTVLTANSAQADGVEWATPSSGGMTVIASGTLSGTSVTLSNLQNLGYVNLQLSIIGATWNTTTAQFAFRYNGSAGSTSYKTYLNGAYGTSNSAQSTYEWSEVTNYNRVYINGEWNNTDALNNQTLIFNNYNGSSYPIINYSAAYKNNLGYITFASGVFANNETSPLNSITMMVTSSLSFTGGTYTLYGVK